MKANAPIFIIIAAIGGFTSGAYIDGEMSPHTPNIPNLNILNLLDNKVFTFIQSAELSGNGQAIIEHATIDFNIEAIKDGEYFKNVLNECIFRSDQSFGGDIFPDDSIDDGICIICKIKGECEDVDEGFLDLPHGTKLGAINSKLATNGIYLTVDARSGGHDTAIIFDGDIPGDLDETPTPDPDLRASGICTDCAGLKMLIIPEKHEDDVTNVLPFHPDFPGNPPPDNLVDVPDDSASGGTMKFQFELPRNIISFDFVDMDRPTAAVHEARAYSDFSCTQLIDSAVTIPNGVDGNVQTITMPQAIQDADARCLKIEAHDSFGVTNLVLECPRIFMDGTILGVGHHNLHEGYTAGEEIHIPIEGMISVEKPQHVDIKIQSAILNFQGLSHGDVLNDQFLGAYGIKISGKAWVGGNLVPRDPVVFDTELTGTSDWDLEVGVGNIAIVQENTNGCEDGTCNDPDDNAAGGIQQYQFEPRRYVNSLIWVDADRPEPFGTIFLYSDYDCTQLIDQGTGNGGINIPFSGEKTTQVLVPVNVEQVGCMIADYTDSGGLSRLNLGCPLPDDPVTMPWFKGDPHVPSDKETIYWIGFDDLWEHENWNVDYNHKPSGRHLKVISENDKPIQAFEGEEVLAGWGVIGSEAWYTRDAFDVSGYHDVMIKVKYSYKSTEAADSFSLYYKDDDNNWVEIFNVPDPAIGNGAQLIPWEMAMVTIPDDDLPDYLELQIRWKSSSDYEWLMIDDLHIEGRPNH